MEKYGIGDFVGCFGSGDDDRMTLVKIAEPCRLAFGELPSAG